MKVKEDFLLSIFKYLYQYYFIRVDNLWGMKDWVSVFPILIFVCGHIFLTITQNPVLHIQILVFLHLWGEHNLNTSEIGYFSTFPFCYWKPWVQSVFHTSEGDLSTAFLQQSVLQRGSGCLQLFSQALQDHRHVAKIKPFLCSQELGGVIFQQVMSSKSQWNYLGQ